ncbi:MAG TPA: TerC/Alx family metal homeostasis membrane protein [Kofleriaceae bacterium]|nr:TerC/Alx family metal homeostasis membrane protein [Kofleriaceae bacterium]
MPLPFSGDAALIAASAAAVLLLLALDLGVLARTPRDPTLRRSAAWTAVWFGLAVAFGAGVTARLGAEHGVAFFSAYLVEQALSVDNLLVLIVIFAQFRVPPAAQRKALVAGVLGAVVLRTALVVGGASLIEQVHAVTYLLGAVLVATAVKLALSGDAKAQEAGEPRPGLVERIARRVLPVSRSLDGTRLLTREAVPVPGGGGRTRLAWRVTPLLIVILVIEVTDLVFALDSVPAVLGVTSDPFLALTSNLAAVLGLRSLFFVVSGLLARLRHLQTGLVLILLFIGIKMLASFAVEIPARASLLVITTLLGGAVLASLRAPRAERPQHEQA